MPGIAGDHYLVIVYYTLMEVVGHFVTHSANYYCFMWLIIGLVLYERILPTLLISFQVRQRFASLVTHYTGRYIAL